MGGGKIDSSSAFLGPNLWNNPDNNDFNLEFMDLDEFLSETGIGVGENSNSNSNETKLTQSQSSPSEGKVFMICNYPIFQPSYCL